VFENPFSNSVPQGRLSKFVLKDASVQQPLFMNRCPFLVGMTKRRGPFQGKGGC
jgi:hypothetical protein